MREISLLSAGLLFLTLGCTPGPPKNPNAPSFFLGADPKVDAFTPPNVGPWDGPGYAQEVASSLGLRISEEVQRYYAAHGRYPTPEQFWQCLGTVPIHNPLNGSATVILDEAHLDRKGPAVLDAGWILNDFPGQGWLRPGGDIVTSADTRQPIPPCTTQPATTRSSTSDRHAPLRTGG